ncbi:hypothetical protein MACH09_39140 [Vibrio sp. MACH09]|uniref:AAA family ATPase n=1 Tax=Vibrio sp. MACH09 TaxID=3025122 RepID=UPI0027928D8F|nr:AAA family ATPase [Vibrio sp. MACH09]GLO63406.1 hypothetical protein MACH09_39140 [Vibrio sp. MACH09]
MKHVSDVTVLIAASEQLDSFSFTRTLAEFGIVDVTVCSLNEDDIIRQVLRKNITTLFLDVMTVEIVEAQKLIQSIVTRTSSKVFAIGQSEEIATYRNMLSAGASDYLVHPVGLEMLQRISLVAEKSNDVQKGKIISVVSAKGGLGSTTIAATLAQLLARQNQTVTSVDLDFAMGDLDLLLNVESNTALVELLQYPERLEPILFERSGVEVSKTHTLFTGYLPLDGAPFWPEKSALEQFNRFCLQSSEYVVMDIPTYSLRDQVGLQALRTADLRIIVVDATLGSLRNANQILKQLQAESNLQNIMVLNHTKSNTASLISVNDAKKALGVSIDVVIPFAPNHFIEKSALGQPAYVGNKKVKAAFQLLLEKITGQANPTRRRFWKRGA